MNWDDIEKELANKAQNERYPIDTDLMWQSVKPHIPTEKKKNRFIIFWLLAGIAMSTLGIHFFQGLPEVDKVMAESNFSSKTLPPAASPKSKTQINAVWHQKTEITDMDQESTVLGDKIAKNRSQKDRRKGDLSITNQRSKNTIDKNDKQSTTHKIAIIAGSINENNQIVENNYPIEKLKLLGSDNRKTQITQWNLAKLQVLGISALYNDLLINRHPSAGLSEILKPERISTQGIYLELAGAVSLGHGKLSLASSDWANSFTQRLNSEQSLPSFSARMSLGLELNQHWRIQAGLKYTHLYKRSISTLNTVQDVTLNDIVIQNIIEPSGTKAVLGSVTVQQVNSTSANRIQHFTSIEIPIDLIYNLRTKQINWEIGAGVAHTFSHSKSGFIHPYENIEYDLSIDEFNWYTKNQLWSAHGLAGIRTTLTGKFDLLARAKYQHYFNPITTDFTGVQESLSGWHIELGTQFHF